MNENNNNPKNEEVVKRKLTGDSKAKLLAVRKAQAEELALLKVDNFSLEEELDEMKSTLLGEEEHLEVREIQPEEPETSVVETSTPEETPVEVVEKKKPTPRPKLTPEEKEKARLALEKEREMEKARLAREKEKEKARLAREKEREKEKARLAREKEREKEKARLAREKEKEKARLVRQKEREKEKARLAREKEKEKARLAREKEKAKERLAREKEKASGKATEGKPSAARSTATKPVKQRVVEKKVAETVDLLKPTESVALEVPTEEITEVQFQDAPVEAVEMVVQEVQEEIVVESDTMDDMENDTKVITDDLEKTKVTPKDEVSPKEFFEGREIKSSFRVSGSVVEKEEEKTSEGKIIIDNLQKLREQIMAQKLLERQLMEQEALKTQQKEKQMTSKLIKLEALAQAEEVDNHQDELKDLEAKNEKLRLELRQANKKLKDLLSLQFDGLPIIDGDKVQVSPVFIEKLQDQATLQLKDDLKQIRTESNLLRAEHDDYVRNRSLERVGEELQVMNEQIEQLNQKITDKDKELLDKEKAFEEQLQKEENKIKRLLDSQEERIAKEIAKRESKLASDYQKKELSLQTRFEQKEVKLQDHWKIKEAKLSEEFKEKEKTLKAELSMKEKEIAAELVNLEMAHKQELEKLDKEKERLSLLTQEKQQLEFKLQNEETQIASLLDKHAQELNKLTKDLEAKDQEEEAKLAALREEHGLEIHKLSQEFEEKLQAMEEENKRALEEKVQAAVIEQQRLLEDKLLVVETEQKKPLEEKLIAFEEERKKLLDEKRALEIKIQVAEAELEQQSSERIATEQSLVAAKADFARQVSALEQTNQGLRMQLEAEKELNAHLHSEYDQKYHEQLLLLQEEVLQNKAVFEEYQLSTKQSMSEQIEQLRNELMIQKEMMSVYKQDIANRDHEISTLKNELAQKEHDIQGLKERVTQEQTETEQKANSRMDELKLEIATLRTTYDNRLNNISLQLEEANKVIRELKHQIEQDAKAFSRLNERMEEEKQSHFETKQTLSHRLDTKEQEISQLKNELSKIPLEQTNAKIEGQIQAMAQIVSELGKAKEHASYPNMMYPPFFQEAYISRSELDRELDRRGRFYDNNRSQEQETKKKDQLSEEFQNKLSSLEIQIKELGDFMKKLPQEVQQNDAIQNEAIKNLTAELDRYKQQLRQDIEQEMKREPRKTSTAEDLIEKYQHDRNLLTYQYNNELSQLEVQKKLAEDDETARAIDEKIKILNIEYAKLIDAKEITFQRDIAKISGIVTPILKPKPLIVQEELVKVKEPEPKVEVDTTFKVYEDAKNVEPKETDVPEEVVREPISDSDFEQVGGIKKDKFVELELELEEDFGEEETPEEDELIEELMEETPVAEVVVETKSTESVLVKQPEVSQSDDYRFVGSIDQNYINRLNNIRNLRATLETKKREHNILYTADTNKNLHEQEGLLTKITVLKNKLVELDRNYKGRKDFNSESEKAFSTEKTKLNLEMQTRQEQLRKLQEEEQRKLDLRYRNQIKSLDDQIESLNQEEEDLKAAHLLKKEKAISRLNRERELLDKLEEEKARLAQEVQQTSPIEEANPRILESSEERKKRMLQQASLPVGQEVEATEELPVEKPTVEPVAEPAAKETPQPARIDEATRQKERELAILFDKYSKAEAKMSSEVPTIKAYKKALQELKALEMEHQKQEAAQTALEKGLTNHPHDAQIKSQIQDLDVLLDNVQVKMEFQKKQMRRLLEDKKVSDYAKVTQRLEQMKELLKKYEQKRKLYENG